MMLQYPTLLIHMYLCKCMHIYLEMLLRLLSGRTSNCFHSEISDFRLSSDQCVDVQRTFISTTLRAIKILLQMFLTECYRYRKVGWKWAPASQLVAPGSAVRFRN